MGIFTSATEIHCAVVKCAQSWRLVMDAQDQPFETQWKEPRQAASFCKRTDQQSLKIQFLLHSRRQPQNHRPQMSLLQTRPVHRTDIQDRRKTKPPDTISKSAMRETRGRQDSGSTDCSKYPRICLGPFLWPQHSHRGVYNFRIYIFFTYSPFREGSGLLETG